MSAPLNARQVAVEVGLSYERFRKVWKLWNIRTGFPSPLSDMGHPRWDAEALQRWKEARAVRRLEPSPDPAPASFRPADLAAAGRQARDLLESLRAS